MNFWAPSGQGKTGASGTERAGKPQVMLGYSLAAEAGRPTALSSIWATGLCPRKDIPFPYKVS